MGKKSRQKRDRRKMSQDSVVQNNLDKATEEIRQFRDLYISEWTRNAKKHETSGDYVWMSSFLSGFEKVVEIGTGDGRGTYQLLQDNHSIVSVDENVSCLEKASVFLLSEGIQLTKELRGEIQINEDGIVDIPYKRIESRLESKNVTLLEGDPLKDPCLTNWLIQNGPFDAVACWNIGTYQLRIPNKNAGCYRKQVQKSIYELADNILRPGGILHIVDRSSIDPSLKDELLEIHTKLAEGTSLVPEQFDMRKINADQVQGGVQLQSNLQTGLALVSMIIRKPMS